MYAGPPPDVRDKHPYHMYEEIKLQPEAIARSLQIASDQVAPASRAIAAARRVLLTGCGTSFHAAQLGAWMLRGFSRGGIEAWPVQAFELATYGYGLRPDDVVVAVTHSGSTTMTMRALDQARRSGTETVVVTGFPQGPAAGKASHLLATGYDQERSWAHTVSYLVAVTTLAALANDLAVPEERLDLSSLPAVVAQALELEEMAHRMAASTVLVERYREPPAIVVAGGGSNSVTALEAVLKLLETSYVHAQSFELEEMLHGPLAAVTAETAVILIAPPGASVERAAQLARATRRIGAIPIVLTGKDNADLFEDMHRLILPDVPEVLSPIPYVVPLQLFSYFLSVGKGYNPDLLRRDDERYREARGEYE
jgi:glutamine---fructose-6-phosphate transaminase (isomerizing)